MTVSNLADPASRRPSPARLKERVSAKMARPGPPRHPWGGVAELLGGVERDAPARTSTAQRCDSLPDLVIVHVERRDHLAADGGTLGKAAKTHHAAACWEWRSAIVPPETEAQRAEQGGLE